MAKHDTPLIQMIDLPAAMGLLTRLPVPVNAETATARGAAGAWAWPLVGVVVGAISGLVALALMTLGLPLPLAAIIALSAQVLMTGALHEDGLADTVDGLWGGYSPARRLEIMKDSHIGAYGVIAISLSLFLRGMGLMAVLAAPFSIASLMVVGLLSRVPMVILMAAMPNARGTGLSQSVGRPTRKTAILGTVVALALAVLIVGTAVLPMFIWISVTTIGLAALAKAKINGQTGDILGSSQQLAEIAALCVLASLAT
ncbi:adenosylcobinamide-GDP ribazoletransferase [Aliiroseovarius lamellibrachiae]|uniref:adenosylcobinamide-GDP ribazoletransferase n=1 Tax=Aliiroseovarius lamellibrachiae TaxID=1924933 RepID=UPI001FED274B|nr:adenosylcobinamide-GDP ribazoletransferase [Aliiroseovarius lamellibrachiae]